MQRCTTTRYPPVPSSEYQYLPTSLSEQRLHCTDSVHRETKMDHIALRQFESRRLVPLLWQTSPYQRPMAQYFNAALHQTLAAASGIRQDPARWAGVEPPKSMWPSPDPPSGRTRALPKLSPGRPRSLPKPSPGRPRAGVSPGFGDPGPSPSFPSGSPGPFRRLAPKYDQGRARRVMLCELGSTCRHLRSTLVRDTRVGYL